MVKYSPIESEFASSEEEAAYDAWLKAKVERSLASDKPRHAHADVMKQVREIIEKYENPPPDME
ncbi:MAG: stability determinant [Blastomonas sp.]|nr:stability determinant [Blastomonas sp.]